MKTILKLCFFLITILFISACAHRPAPAKIGDEHISVPSISKSSTEALGQPSPSVIETAKKCICIQLWMPVCGENGKTYSNSCFANCAGVKYKNGSCQKDITD